MEMKFYRIVNSNIPNINISSEIANILIIDISSKINEYSNNRDISSKINEYSNNRECFINSDPRQ